MPSTQGRFNEAQQAGSGSCEPGGLNNAGQGCLRAGPFSLPYPGGQGQGRKAVQAARSHIARPQTPQISKNWQAGGIPCRIASEALETALKRSQREELARAETYLYRQYIARLPLRAFRLNERTASKLIEARLSSGQWIEIKEARNYRKITEDGPALRKLSPVYMLDPAYLAEIAAEDMKRGRLSALTASKPPGHRKPKPPDNIDRKAALWLSQGGISWRPLPLLSMLADPLEYYPAEEAGNGWHSMLQGWRILAGSTASRGLCPQWKIDRIGGLHASKPALQALPGIVREYALTVDGYPLAELDYSSCQLNIANHGRGVGIMADPLEDLRRYLQAQGLYLLREQIKACLYPLFHGRRRSRFILRAQWDIGLTEEQAAVLWEALQPLKTGSGRRLMEVQAQIMQRALEILAGLEAWPALPLYDAIATAEEEKTRYAMEAASAEILGEPLPLKAKTARQRSLFTG